MTKVSIIIPVYNTEKYLEECLKSIINQTFKDTQIICVDDGSTDNSLEILKNYANKDSRISIIKQENQYAGIARNNGLKIAKGEFVIFLDSDDIYNSTMLEKMVNESQKTNADITICKVQKLDQKTQEIAPLKNGIKNELLKNNPTTPEEIKTKIFQFCIAWPWNKLYRKDFILKHNLRFQNLRQSNDTYFVLMSLVCANKISIIDDILITHRYHNNSLEATRAKSCDCFYKAIIKLKNELLKRNLFENYKQSFINYALEFSYWHLKTITNKELKPKMQNLFYNLLKEIEFEKYNINYFYNKKLCKKIKFKLFIKKYFLINFK